MKGVRTPNNCYGITSKSGITCNFAKVDETELWHQRLVHTNFNDAFRFDFFQKSLGVCLIELCFRGLSVLLVSSFLKLYFCVHLCVFSPNLNLVQKLFSQNFTHAMIDM